MESYFKRWASVAVSVRSLAATNSISGLFSPARTTFLPIRPKPLIPTLVAIDTSILRRARIEPCRSGQNQVGNSLKYRRGGFPEGQFYWWTLKNPASRPYLKTSCVPSPPAKFGVNLKPPIGGTSNGIQVARERSRA